MDQIYPDNFASDKIDLEAASFKIEAAKEKVKDNDDAPEVWSNRDRPLIINFSRIHENFAFHLRKIKIDQNLILFSEEFKKIIFREYTVGQVFPEIDPHRTHLTSEEEDTYLGKFYPLKIVEVCKKFLKEIKDDSKMYPYQTEATAVAQIRLARMVAVLGYLEARTFYVRWMFFEHEWHDKEIPCNCGGC